MNRAHPKVDCSEKQNKKERIKMKSKTKNTKVPKADKTRLSDLRPKKDALGGGALPTPPQGGVPGTGPVQGGKTGPTL